MAKFNVGDRVRCVSKRMVGPRKGDEGKIVRLPDADALGRYEVQFDKLFYGYMMKEDELVSANALVRNAKFRVGDKVLIDGSGLYNPVEILKVEEIPLGRRVNTFYTVKLSYGTKRVIEDVVRAANSSERNDAVRAVNASEADDRKMWERIKGKAVYQLNGDEAKFYWALADRIKGKSTGIMTEVEKAFWDQETNKVAKSVIGAGRGKYHLDPNTRAWTNATFVSTAKDKLVAEVENRLGRELTMDEMFEIGSKARPGMRVDDVLKVIGMNSTACNDAVRDNALFKLKGYRIPREQLGEGKGYVFYKHGGKVYGVPDDRDMREAIKDAGLAVVNGRLVENWSETRDFAVGDRVEALRNFNTAPYMKGDKGTVVKVSGSSAIVRFDKDGGVYSLSFEGNFRNISPRPTASGDQKIRQEMDKYGARDDDSRYKFLIARKRGLVGKYGRDSYDKVFKSLKTSWTNSAGADATNMSANDAVTRIEMLMPFNNQNERYEAEYMLQQYGSMIRSAIGERAFKDLESRVYGS